MIRQIAIVVLVVLCAGAWFYLDYMNKQEEVVAAQMRQEVVKMRESGEANRARVRAQFEAGLRTEFTNCQAEAEKARSEYLTAALKPLPKKAGEFVITQAVLDESARILSTRNADCQLGYDTRMQKGS